MLGDRTALALNPATSPKNTAKDGKLFTRVLNEDRTYSTPRPDDADSAGQEGGELTLPGRSLMFVRTNHPDHQRRDRH